MQRPSTILAAVALLALVALPAAAAQWEGRVIALDRDAGTLTLETDAGERRTLAVGAATRFDDAEGLASLAPGDRVRIEAREREIPEAEREAGRTHRADVIDARETPPDLDQHDRSDGKPYDRLGMMVDEGPAWEAVRIARAEAPEPSAPPVASSPPPAPEPGTQPAAPAPPVQELPKTASDRPLGLGLALLALAAGLTLRGLRRRAARAD